MTKLTCIAIDDEPLALDLVEDFCSRFPTLNLLKTFDDALAAKEFLKSQSVDLIFLDINMPEISGIDFASSIDSQSMIIFTTAYRDYAVEGFELNALDYLVKPFEFDRFSKAVDRALEAKSSISGEENKATYIYVSSEYKMVKVDTSQIEYLESMEDYVKIHITGAKTILTLSTLKVMLDKLPMGKFVRIHRSYIIPIDKIKYIASKKVVLNSLQELSIGASFADSVQNLTQFLANRESGNG